MRATSLIFLLALGSAQAAAPKVGPERIVLQTPAGDIVVALYPETAPAHAAKFLSLVRSGAYDGTKLLKVRTPVYLHFSGVGARRTPLTAEQLAAIPKLKPAPGKAPPKTGVLAMARDKDDPDETGTSFLILLADIPGLGTSFTIFGEVRGGMEVAWALANAPLNASGRPRARVEVGRAFAVDSAKELEKVALKPVDFPALKALPEEGGGPPLRGLGALLGAAGLALFFLNGRRGTAASIGLLSALSGFFLALVAAAPSANSTPWTGTFLMVLAVAVFWLMGRFES